jgi:hypothetical protein
MEEGGDGDDDDDDDDDYGTLNILLTLTQHTLLRNSNQTVELFQGNYQPPL